MRRNVLALLAECLVQDVALLVVIGDIQAGLLLSVGHA